MKPTLFRMPIALIALMLTGCAGDKPASQLDSPDRSERIAAAAVAGDTHAAPASAAAAVSKPAEPLAPVIAPASRIAGSLPGGEDRDVAGCWAQQAGDQVYFRIFNSDGTCKEAACIVGPASSGRPESFSSSITPKALTTCCSAKTSS